MAKGTEIWLCNGKYWNLHTSSKTIYSSMYNTWNFPEFKISATCAYNTVLTRIESFLPYYGKRKQVTKGTFLVIE